jgi:hypothetical protein
VILFIQEYLLIDIIGRVVFRLLFLKSRIIQFHDIQIIRDLVQHLRRGSGSKTYYLLTVLFVCKFKIKESWSRLAVASDRLLFVFFFEAALLLG